MAFSSCNFLENETIFIQSWIPADLGPLIPAAKFPQTAFPGPTTLQKATKRVENACTSYPWPSPLHFSWAAAKFAQTAFLGSRTNQKTTKRAENAAIPTQRVENAAIPTFGLPPGTFMSSCQVCPNSLPWLQNQSKNDQTDEECRNSYPLPSPLHYSWTAAKFPQTAFPGPTTLQKATKLGRERLQFLPFALFMGSCKFAQTAFLGSRTSQKTTKRTKNAAIPTLCLPPCTIPGQQPSFDKNAAIPTLCLPPCTIPGQQPSFPKPPSLAPEPTKKRPSGQRMLQCRRNV